MSLQAVIERPEDAEKPLTYRQQQLVKAVVSGRFPSVAKAAESIGMRPESAYAILGYRSVATELEAQKQRRLDKARGPAQQLRAITAKLTRKMSAVADEDLSPAEVGGLLKIALEGQKLSRDLGLDDEEQGQAEQWRQLYRQIRARGFAVAKYLEERRRRNH